MGYMLSTLERKRLRRIAHRLEPIVVVSERGLSPAVIGETHRALTDHELIKARLNLSDRHARKECGRSLAEQCAAEIVQEIGKVIVLYRGNPDADPHLSNVARHR
jgi:RNA-binding protein